MSKIADGLRSKGIQNINQFAAGQVVIVFRPAFKGDSAWLVKRIAEPNAEGFGGNDEILEVFDVANRSEHANRLAVAKAWAAVQFGITRWASEPFCGGYMDASFLRSRLAELR